MPQWTLLALSRECLVNFYLSFVFYLTEKYPRVHLFIIFICIPFHGEIPTFFFFFFFFFGRINSHFLSFVFFITDKYLLFSFVFYFTKKYLFDFFSNCVNQEQSPRITASDPSMRCLPMSFFIER